MGGRLALDAAWLFAAFLLLVVVLAAALATRRYLLERGGGTVECGLRNPAERGAWRLGVAAYEGDELCWYGALDVRFRPEQVLHRRSLTVKSRRPSLAAEASVLGHERVVVELSTGDSDNVELAMTEEALTGFLAWLEASPPGSHLAGMALRIHGVSVALGAVSESGGGWRVRYSNGNAMEYPVTPAVPMVNSGSMRADDDGEDLLAGYVTGPAAATEATAEALARAEWARAVVLVEGVSDQIAVETLAGRRGRDLAAEGVVVLPAGGAHGIARYLRRFGPEGTGARLAGLCDAGEAHIVQRALAAAGLERLGFFVCTEDLEDELIRAAGPVRVMEALAAHGDLRSFRTIQRQPAWRGKDEAAQLRRFLGAGAQRKLRYARLLTEAVSLDWIPEPLAALLSAV